ncbi:uncharacterized protein LOC125185341 [Salvia hispanica]|uniref:uncharacterized protein LOC125185341 n=1 Tax=Salvia hispanica TaxID=49212 RepID=UPI002009C25F|nr:uncharacterized protein LOC125185341 [Salvia hispanica]
MQHPSHPQHELRFSKKTRWCPFPCDACGATEEGDSYTCTLCDYWIHERCVLLPESKDFPHHHHSLSLAFYPSPEYIRYEFVCGICSTNLPLRHWVYHCVLCRYVVHLNCATSTFDTKNENANTIDDEKDGTKFPIAVEDMYEEMIRFEIDIKCASLPDTIKHASHQRHNYLKLVKADDFRCVMLPATNKHRLENHLLPLTYDACVNRPGDFYCSNCEVQMEPTMWMYHCRDCDQSFHPRCFPATSGDYRNIKYGTQYVISNIHDHPLRFQIISKKKKCGLCHRDKYDWPGFQCVSCFFVVCKACGKGPSYSH